MGVQCNEGYCSSLLLLKFGSLERPRAIVSDLERPRATTETPGDLGKGEGLLGWRCRLTFPTGPKAILKWHDAIVIGVGMHDFPDQGRVLGYRVFVECDSQDEWITLPDDDVCFLSSQTHDHKVPWSEVLCARQCIDG